MKPLSASRWLRLRRLLNPYAFYDAFCALAERSRAGFRQLRCRLGAELFRPAKQKKRSYWPEVLVLEKRLLPSLTVVRESFGGYAGVPLVLYQTGFFSDSNGLKAPSAYTATITWGDGSPNSPGVIGPVPGTDVYNVYGSHTFALAQYYTITLAVSGDGSSGSSTLPGVINPPALQVTLEAAGPYTDALLNGLPNLTVSSLDNNGTTCGCTNPAQANNYNGNTVAVQPIFQVKLGTSASGGLPSEIDVGVTFGGSSQATVVFDATGRTAGETLLMNVQRGSTVTASDSYPWTVNVAVVNGGMTTTYSNSGTAHLAVSSASEGVRAGNGWTFAGVNRLIATSDGVIWKDGAGFGRFFAGTGSGALTYTSPPGEFGTLARNGGGSYSYTSSGGLWSDDFNSSGLQTDKVTADGLRTTMTYSGVKLTGIEQPDGRQVTFTYDGSGNVQTVQGPAGTATFTHDGSGGLTGVQRPDGSRYTVSYDAAGRATNEKRPDAQTTYNYDSHGLLTGTDAGLGVTSTVQPVLAVGWGPHAASAVSAVAVVTDALGASTTVTLDSQGDAALVQNAAGLRQTLSNSNYQPALQANGAGRLSQYGYDGSGDRTSATDPSGAVTTTQYDATLHEPTVVINPLGERLTMTYSGTGDRQTSTDADGGTTTYTWSGGLLQSETDPLGHTTSFVYDGNDNMVAEIAPTGLHTSYTYDAAGNRTSVQQPDGTLTTTQYDALGDVTGTIHPDGSRTTMTYDGAGHRVSASDVHGNLTTFVYDADGRQTTVIDPLGNRATTTYDDAGRVQATTDLYGNATTFVYDAAGRQVATEDRYGHYTTTVYDDAGQVSATVDVYGNRTSFTYDDAGRQVTAQDPYGNVSTSVYDAAGELTASVDPYGNRTSFVYDAAGRQVASEDQYGHFTTSVFDAAGNVTARIDVFGNRTTFVFDAYGRQVAAEDQYGHYATTVFDAYGRPSAQVDVFGHAVTTSYDAYARVQGTVDALGNHVTFAYDGYGEQVSKQDSTGTATTVYDGFGRVSAQVDQLGNRATNVYDGFGRVQATVDALGNRTSFVFDASGRPSATEDARGGYVTTVYDAYGRVSANVDQLGDRTTFLYDSNGRQAAVEDARGNFVTTVYDSQGRVAATENALGQYATTVYDSQGRVAASEDGRGNFVTTIYDSYGRSAATEDSRGGYVTTLYDTMGRVQATENKLGNATTTAYDGYGRTAGSTDPLGHTSTVIFDTYGRQVANEDALGHYTTQVLDALGRQVNVIDANLNKTTFVYDALSRVVQEITPTGGNVTMAYDADGRLASETDALGRRIDYGYDANSNKTGETWHNADGSTSYATFTYDAANHDLTAANSTGTYTLTYDANGEVAGEKGVWGTQLTLTYDGAGHRTVVQDNFGGVTTNAYDPNSNLTQQQFAGSGQTPMRIDQTYDANNELTDVLRYSDLAGTTKVATTSHVYDAAGELTGQIDRKGDGTSIANCTNVYDAAGRITSEQLNGAAPTTYSYDATNQLTGDGHTSPVYDAEGNRTGTGYSVGTGNELQSDATWTYTYDAAGNETKKVAITNGQSWKYGYDTKNELVKAQLWTNDPDVYGTGDTLLKEVDYKYDVWGNLAERDDYPTGTGSPTVTRYAVDGWNPALAGQTGTANFNVWAELDGSNAVQTRYLHGDAVDQLFGRQDAGVAYWTLTDRQESVRDVVDSGGAVKDAISYDAWGNIVSDTNSAYRGQYSWTGRQFDVEIDLQYNRARWYDPATARWQSQDPLGFGAGDSNLYRYVNNESQAGIDPSGLLFVIRPGFMAATVQAATVTGDVATMSVQWNLPNLDGFVLEHYHQDYWVQAQRSCWTRWYSRGQFYQVTGQQSPFNSNPLDYYTVLKVNRNPNGPIPFVNQGWNDNRPGSLKPTLTVNKEDYTVGVSGTDGFVRTKIYDRFIQGNKFNGAFVVAIAQWLADHPTWLGGPIPGWTDAGAWMWGMYVSWNDRPGQFFEPFAVNRSWNGPTAGTQNWVVVMV